MNYIGNDIISLTSSENLQSFRNPKYITKVLNKSELFAASTINLSILLPLFWSVKESAYKILLKTGRNISFSPRMFDVKAADLLSFGNRMKYFNEANVSVSLQVTAYGLSFVSFSEINNEFIHTICAFNKKGLEKSVSRVKTNDDLRNQSEVAIKLLKEGVSAKTGIPFSELHLVKNERNIPVLTQKGLPLTIDVSLSHDDGYIAYVFLIR